MASKLAQMQARFQQKQMQEKEEKLLKLYENQQQRAFERVGRGSAGSNGSLTNITTGKVRQMFDERRQKAGIDRSYPLEPLKSKNRTTSLDRKITVNTTTNRTLNKTKNLNNTSDNYAKQRDIVSMMNDHNLCDNLDDEVMPQLGGFDDYDEVIFTGKLANVGGKLPSQNGATTKVNNTKKEDLSNKGGNNNNKNLATTINNRSINGNNNKKESKPVVKSTIQKVSKRPPSAASSSSSSSGSHHSTPNKMNSAKPTQAPATNTTRPSAKVLRQTPVQRDDLIACRYCQRRFATDRIQLHEDICGRTGKKKRKAYDATKHRVSGTEAEVYVKKSGKTKNPTKQPVSSAPPKSNWRQKHEEFISAIRAAKEAQAHIAKGGDIRDLPPPPPSSNPDYVQCPHCGRKFNQSAAERHIPKCASFQFNKPKNGRGGKR